MKKKSITIVAAALTLFVASCETTVNNVNVAAKEAANDSSAAAVASKEIESKSVYNVDATSIGFTAFKTTEKFPVKGWFKSFSISKINQAERVEEVFANASISIDVASLETNDEGRNQRLISEFFGKTTSNESIEGKVVAFDAQNSTAALSLNFNGVEKELTFNYSLSGDTLNMNSSLNLADVNGLEALASLNKACEVLHKGADGVSKTWEDVEINISTVLNK